MKQLLALAVLLCSASAFQAQGIEFFHGTWEEALQEAKSQEKIIFVDAYAVWCGPCRRMAKNVFPNEKVGEFFNKHFINVKMDMESEEGLKFGRKYPVQAYPTLLFIDYTGEVVHSVRGARSVEQLLQLGEAALKKIDRSGQYAEAYEAGNRDPELVYNYIKALNQAGKPSLRIVNDYLRTQKDLSTEINLRILFEGTTQADSRVFELLVQHKKAVAQLMGYQQLLERIEKACQNTVERAVEYKSTDLLEEAKRKMKTHHPKAYEAFALKADMEFYAATRDHKNFLKACSAYAKKVAAENAEELRTLAERIAELFPQDDKCMKQAENIAHTAAEKGRQYQHYLTYANILLQNGKKDKALEAAQRAREAAKKSGPIAERIVENWIEKVSG